MRPLTDTTPEQDQVELIDLAHEIVRRAVRAIGEINEGHMITAGELLQQIVNDIDRIKFLSKGAMD